jgi:hypothetical protein
VVTGWDTIDELEFEFVIQNKWIPIVELVGLGKASGLQEIGPGSPDLVTERLR